MPHWGIFRRARLVDLHRKSAYLFAAMPSSGKGARRLLGRGRVRPQIVDTTNVSLLTLISNFTNLSSNLYLHQLYSLLDPATMLVQKHSAMHVGLSCSVLR